MGSADTSSDVSGTICKQAPSDHWYKPTIDVLPIERIKSFSLRESRNGLEFVQTAQLCSSIQSSDIISTIWFCCARFGIYCLRLRGCMQLCWYKYSQFHRCIYQAPDFHISTAWSGLAYHSTKPPTRINRNVSECTTSTAQSRDRSGADLFRSSFQTAAELAAPVMLNTVPETSEQLRLSRIFLESPFSLVPIGRLAGGNNRPLVKVILAALCCVIVARDVCLCHSNMAQVKR